MLSAEMHARTKKSKRSVHQDDSSATESENEEPPEPKKSRIDDPEELSNELPNAIDVIFRVASQFKDLREELELAHASKESCREELERASEREEAYKADLERASLIELSLRAQVTQLWAVKSEMTRELRGLQEGLDTMGEDATRLIRSLDRAQSVIDSMERPTLSE